MSRIFEALRQSLQESVPAAAEARELPAVKAYARPGVIEPRGFEESEVLACKLPGDGRVLARRESYDLAAEKFRLLAHRLNRIRGQRSLSKVAVTSSVPKEGKTVVSLNLAAILARTPRRVVLVDADMRQPGTHRALGVPRLPGLAEVLNGELRLSGVIRRLEPLDVYYLPAGHAVGNPFELLQSARFRDVLQSLSLAFDWVVFDTPPLIPSADAQYLANAADGVLLVVRPGVTPRESFERARTSLEGARLIGLVLNASDDGNHERYYYEHYSDAGSNGKAAPRFADCPRKGDTGR